MQRVANHRFLYQRNGSYYFRRAVPEDARGGFDGLREVKTSLHTASLSEARLKAAKCLASFEHRLRQSRERSGHRSLPTAIRFEPTREEIEAGVRGWLIARLAVTAPSFGGPVTAEAETDGEDPQTVALRDYEKSVLLGLKTRRVPLLTEWVADTLAADQGWEIEKGSAAWTALCDVVARGQVEFARRATDQLSLVDGKVHSPMFAAEQYRQDEQKARASGLTLGAAVDAFLADPRMGANEKTKAKYRGHLDTMVEVLGVSRRIRTVTREECRSVRDDVVRKLPRHRSLKFPGTTVQDAIARGQKSGAPIIDAKTQNLMLDNLQALFEWAKDYDHRPDNPARNLRVATARTKTRRPFTAGELRRIFNAPLYTGCADDEAGYAKPGANHPRRHRFWLPLLGLFTGMRLNELCQLRSGDLELVEGEWVINVLPDPTVGKRLKTVSSARRVPVHPELIRMGLAASFRGGKSLWLFPDIDHEGDEGGSDAQSKWFGRFLNSVGIQDRGAVFHSFRHGFRDALREGGVSEEVALALGGWTDSKVGNRYGAGHSLATLREGVSKLKYPGLDLTHLKPQPPI